MAKTTLQLIVLALTLVLAQAVVFNNVCLFNVAMPFVFIYVLLRLPVTLAVNWLLTISFFMGLVIDIFADTYGMNALACTLLAMGRRPILRLYVPREDDMSVTEPSIHSLGMAVYAKYMFTMTLYYCTCIFVIEAFTFFNPLQLLLRIIASTLLSGLIMLGIDSLISKRSEKRL
jgi:hypothetical protein